MDQNVTYSYYVADMFYLTIPRLSSNQDELFLCSGYTIFRQIDQFDLGTYTTTNLLDVNCCLRDHMGLVRQKQLFEKGIQVLLPELA